MGGISKFNKSGAYDPTAYAALCRVSNSQKRKKKHKQKAKYRPPKPRPFVYIASPYRGDTKTNVDNALRYCRFAVARGRLPIAPHVWLPQFMDDDISAERTLALNMGLWLLAQCTEVWVFGNVITEGMVGEIQEARRLGIKIRRFADAATGIRETRRNHQC